MPSCPTYCDHQSRGLLYRDSGFKLPGQNAIAVFSRLFFKISQEGMLTTRTLWPFRAELLVDAKAQRYFTAGSHKDQIRFAIGRVRQHISPLVRPAAEAYLARRCRQSLGGRGPGLLVRA